MKNYIRSTSFLNFEHEAIQAFVADCKDDSLSDKEKAIKVYLKVRDGIQYNALNISEGLEHYIASNALKKENGHCIDKSIILTACLRAVGIPARMHLAKVKNHIAAEKLIALLGTDELAPHGMVDIYLNGKWLKTSPAFDKETCDKYNINALDFDGEKDSLFQEFNTEGTVFMEYLEDYGHFEDVPADRIAEIFTSTYPNFTAINAKAKTGRQK